MKKPCKKEYCVFCEEEFDCLFWHSVTQHNEPPLFSYVIDEAEDELEYHLGHLWGHIKVAIFGKEKINVLKGTNSRDLIALASRENKKSD